jgi:signal recognition particle subunit SRP54
LRKSELTLQDFLEQLRQLQKMGPIEELLKMLPGVPKAALQQGAPDTKRLKRFEAILSSMTPGERLRPRILDGSRRRRIAAGSGTTVPEVNQLIRDFDQAKTMVKRMRHGPRGFAGLGRGKR